MITTETPYKLAEIIRSTWPGIYMRPKTCYDENPIAPKENGKKH